MIVTEYNRCRYLIVSVSSATCYNLYRNLTASHRFSPSTYPSLSRVKSSHPASVSSYPSYPALFYPLDRSSGCTPRQWSSAISPRPISLCWWRPLYARACSGPLRRFMWKRGLWVGCLGTVVQQLLWAAEVDHHDEYRCPSWWSLSWL